MRVAGTVCLMALTLYAKPSSEQENVQHDTVETTAKQMNRNGLSFFEIGATAFARATPEQTWLVLTDYDRLSEFVPDLEVSRLVSRNARQALVEQQSRAGFLFLSQTIRLVVRVTERPFSELDVALVSGDMKHYTAHWTLAPETQNGIDGTRLTYSGTMEPDFFVPPLFGRSLVQANLKRMVEAVVLEVDRRHAQR
jgi:ribosome-associated toxin RatA of RatAB toxin-antitoxin module